MNRPLPHLALTCGMLALLALDLPAQGAPPPPTRAARAEAAKRSTRKETPPKPVRAKPGKPRVVRDYLAVRVRIQRGKGHILAAKRGHFAKPTPVYSYWGPFQLRLYAGRQLHDTIRFNFPLSLPVGERTRHNTALDRDILRGLTSETVVRVPFHASLTHLVLTGEGLQRSVRLSLRRAPERVELPDVSIPQRTGPEKR